MSMSTPNCFYAIIDIKSAYRWVPIYPPHRQLQGFRWSFYPDQPAQYYVDNFLCFGLANAPSIFNRISQSIVRTMLREGFTIVAYLDDFLVIRNDIQHCQAAHQYLLSLIGRLGFSVNWDKVISPTTRVQFLGLIIDSLLQRIELPQDKLQKLLAICSEYLSKRKITKRELQVIVGHMTFASRAVYGARTFTRIFIDAMNSLQKQHFRIRLTKLLINELTWWTKFAKNFNGLCPCQLGASRPVVIISTDASFTGFGAVMDKQ